MEDLIKNFNFKIHHDIGIDEVMLNVEDADAGADGAGLGQDALVLHGHVVAREPHHARAEADVGLVEDCLEGRGVGHGAIVHERLTGALGGAGVPPSVLREPQDEREQRAA